jgi:hypothetical protein
LTLNIAVAVITTVRFYRAGHFAWSLPWPFLVASIPLAFIGGAITLPDTVYPLSLALCCSAPATDEPDASVVLVGRDSLAIDLLLIDPAGALERLADEGWDGR